MKQVFLTEEEEMMAIQMYQAKVEAKEYCREHNISEAEIQEEENGYRVNNRLFRI